LKTDFFATWQVLTAAGVYAAGMLWIAYYSSFPPRDWLLVRLQHFRVRDGFRDHPTEVVLKKTASSLEKWWRVRRSFVQASWRQVHAIEDDYVMRQPLGEVRTGLATIRDRLRLLNTEEAGMLLDRVENALGDEDVTDEHRALLRECQAYRHYLNDSAYEELSHVMGKALWLAVVGLAVVVVLSEAKDRELYFLLGATGGLMSRLMRLLKEEPASTDYGAAWSTLILSPVSGAIAAWIGIALVAALGTDPVSLIDQRMPPLIWDQGDHVLGLGLAFLLGFSERLFSGVVEVSEERFTALATKTRSEGTASERRTARRPRRRRAER
jgi:membrane associated rhomboid family serine protease